MKRRRHQSSTSIHIGKSVKNTAGREQGRKRNSSKRKGQKKYYSTNIGVEARKNRADRRLVNRNRGCVQSVYICGRSR